MTNDLKKALENLIALHEMQASLNEIDLGIERAKALLDKDSKRMEDFLFYASAIIAGSSFGIALCFVIF